MVQLERWRGKSHERLSAHRNDDVFCSETPGSTSFRPGLFSVSPLGKSELRSQWIGDTGIKHGECS